MVYLAFLLFFNLISCFPSSSHAQNANLNLPLKSVNLGNWLVTEGWMQPSRFDGIVNKDLLDGTQVQFLSTRLNKYLCAESGGGTIIVANRASASGWETFRLWRVNASYFNFRVFFKQFVGLGNQGVVQAVLNGPTNSATFEIAQSETRVTADYRGSSWDDWDPSVFRMTIVTTLQGEYQITNGYGPDRAPQVMQDHWNSYITEQDFNFMSSNGLDAVRVPVGWWIAQDPNPPRPFVGGSSRALDNAFTWAEKYGMKVIIDLHAVKDSQNGNDHSGTRDGFQEWGDSNIGETVAVIEYLAARYGGRLGLAAIELMNEPLAPGVTFDALAKYYRAGYDAVRKHTYAYVILSARLGPADPQEFFSLASSMNRVVIDVHNYNLFSDMFSSMSVLQNIDYIYNQRASDLGRLISANGPRVFIDLKLPLRAVNLGNWLVTEGWMKPSRFDGIINKDLLDGAHVQFLSTKLNKYLCAENGGGTVLVANRISPSDWETFRLWRVNESYFNLRVLNKQFVGLGNQGVKAVSNTPTHSETFQIVRKDDAPNRVRLKASNGFFLQVQSETLVTADYTGSSWDDSDPSVLNIAIVNTLQGEYQITNGYGPVKAPQVMQAHWDSYITEQDFKFISANGLSAVRIPVGWWIAQDPNPPKPFVGGSLKALDNAFTWAEKYGMKVVVDLHAAKASQNRFEHSGARDGFLEWGDSNIDETVAVIEFLAARYGGSPSLGAIELMNEPWAPDVTLDALTKYYKAGYDAIRKHTNAYVILSARLGPANPKELFPFARSLNRVAIDVHWYNLFTDMFITMIVQQNIDYIYNQRSSDLDSWISADGEWTGEFGAKNGSMEDYKRYTKAEVDVFGGATFGWAYWSYKCEENHWSLKWMIDNNFIQLNMR
ncbi:hypothetical protein GOBAR_AA01751 [Gossypium barbadense]|uniref:Uncharacterized protein n=1 Tax=Gossypium barbadense TaxID=3634 RepID=A0A2P5YTB0_GOSBA|nr:hypothetical protein GOBAR_AA01751 [Gossypium barbadense]